MVRDRMTPAEHATALDVARALIQGAFPRSGRSGGTATQRERLVPHCRVVLGQLNGHVEEMFTGHKIVKAFGREAQSVAEFNELNGRYYDAGWRAQFVSGTMMPVMTFIGNLGFVAVAGLFVTVVL